MALAAGMSILGFIAVLALFVLLLPGWIFGGGALLFVGGRFLAQSPRATYWWSVATNVASVLAGSVASGGVAGIGLAMLGLQGPGTVWFLLGGFAAGLLASWWVIRAMFSVSFGKAILAWLPTFWQLLGQPAIVLAIATPFLVEARDTKDTVQCAQNLQRIGQALATRQAVGRIGGTIAAEATDLDAIASSDDLPGAIPRCPAAQRKGPPRHGKYDYFCHALGGPGGPRRIVACDFRGNHPGGIRNVLYSDGTILKLTESRFQAELARDHNADFAKALHAAEGP